MDAGELLSIQPVIPVISVGRVEDAVPLAETLVGAGCRVLEVTLRTSAGLASIEAMRKAVPSAIVGAGTIRTGDELRAARDAGCQFGVSPGTSAALLDAIATAGLTFLPGAQTASEIAALRDRGYGAIKFFPAEAAGGVPVVRAFGDVFPDLIVCPTGGISADNAGDYLALPSVRCVGGSWLTPRALVESRDWRAIAELAAAAMRLDA